MIDVEFDVYDHISDALRDEYGDSIYISSEYFDTSTKFPAVSIFEINNTVYQKMRTVNIENAAQITYEVNVFSNNSRYKKFEVKAIMQIIDNAFSAMNFTRIMAQPISNLQDATIYRMIARYEAVVDKEHWLYTN